MQWIYCTVVIFVIFNYQKGIVFAKDGKCPSDWNDEFTVLYTKNKTASPFTVDIMPNNYKGKRDPFKALILSSSYITILPSEKMFIYTKKGGVFMTKVICVETTLSRNVVIVWYRDKKKVHKENARTPKTRDRFSRTCIFPDQVGDTQANKIIVRLFRMKNDIKEMTIKGVTISVCF